MNMALSNIVYFVDPETGCDHTQSIEVTGTNLNKIALKASTSGRISFHIYINEFIWKKEFKEHRMYELWKLIGRLFPCT
uniref:Uncharacterized protein n=1 Tax=Ditylenchus dipsaci TaxID=166011 RepID=A0A915EID0_9BILA